MESVSVTRAGTVSSATRSCAIRDVMPTGSARMERVYVSPDGMANIVRSKVVREGECVIQLSAN